MGMFKNLLTITIKPNSVFPYLKENPSWLLPWLILSILGASVQLGFYAFVDSDYLLNALIQENSLLIERADAFF